jgi:endogenous inhibitor of DNA gyrase (YacG/DUF329 family)
MVMNTATLATAIQRDLLRDKPAEKPDGRDCHACGRPFLPKPSATDDNTYAFCSARCREAYDNGWPAYAGPVEQFNKLKQTPVTADNKFRIIAGPPGVTEYNPLKGSARALRAFSVWVRSRAKKERAAVPSEEQACAAAAPVSGDTPATVPNSSIISAPENNIPQDNLSDAIGLLKTLATQSRQSNSVTA